MVKISANRMVLNRIAVCRTFVQVDTQRLRGKLMRKLEELHDPCSQRSAGLDKLASLIRICGS
jgi:hypothetical protein